MCIVHEFCIKKSLRGKEVPGVSIHISIKSAIKKFESFFPDLWIELELFCVVIFFIEYNKQSQTKGNKKKKQKEQQNIFLDSFFFSLYFC